MDLENINNLLNKRLVRERKRNYIGLSQAGDHCERRIWLSNKKEPVVISAKTKRIFEAGKMYEKIVIKELQKAGLYIADRQKEITIYDCKNVKGHIDGAAIVNNEHVIVEIKSMNNARFELFKKGNIKKDFYEYYAQCQVYMLSTQTEKTLLIAINKDNEEIFINVIELDKFVAEVELNKLKKLATQENEPDKLPDIKGVPDWRCQNCFYKNHCWQ